MADWFLSEEDFQSIVEFATKHDLKKVKSDFEVFSWFFYWFSVDHYDMFEASAEVVLAAVDKNPMQNGKEI